MRCAHEDGEKITPLIVRVDMCEAGLEQNPHQLQASDSSLHSHIIINTDASDVMK
jgi:hypothetical protein